MSLDEKVDKENEVCVCGGGGIYTSLKASPAMCDNVDELWELRLGIIVLRNDSILETVTLHST